MGQGKVGSSKITRNQQEREIFRVDVMLSPSQGLGITQELQGCGFGEINGIIPSGSCCWRSLQSRNLLPLVGFGAGHSRKGWHSLAGWKNRMGNVPLELWELLLQHRTRTGQAALGSLTAFGSPKLTLLLHGLQFCLSRALSSSSHDTLLPLLSLGLIPAGFISVPAV